MLKIVQLHFSFQYVVVVVVVLVTINAMLVMLKQRINSTLFIKCLVDFCNRMLHYYYHFSLITILHTSGSSKRYTS